MTNNNIWIIMLMFGGGLWALGGEQLTIKISGQKWIRRIILPLFLGAFLYFRFHQEQWKVIAFMILSFGAYTLPYGDKNPWWVFQKDGKFKLPKWLVASLIPIPVLLFGFSWWIPLFPILFLAMFKASNEDEKNFSWVVCSFFFGCFIVAALKGAIH